MQKLFSSPSTQIAAECFETEFLAIDSPLAVVRPLTTEGNTFCNFQHK